MPFTTAAKNAMLPNHGITHVSLHSAFPGAGGANEISGGAPAYARKAVAFGAAAGAAQSQTGTAVLDVAGGTTVQFFGYWSALTGGTFLGAHPLGNFAAREFLVDTAADTIRAIAHGYANADRVVFMDSTVPGGLTEGVLYFVVGTATDTFQVSLTNGGAAIDLTSQAGNGCQVIKCVPEAPGSQATITVQNCTLNLLF